MRLDLAHPAAEKITLVLEGIGEGKVRVNSSSLDHPVVVLPDQGLEIVGIQKKVMVGRVARSAYWPEPRSERTGRGRGTGRRRSNSVTAHQRTYVTAFQDEVTALQPSSGSSLRALDHCSAHTMPRRRRRRHHLQTGTRRMMLVYNLPRTEAIFERFGGVDGSAIWSVAWA
jgi:hypothetical protein